MIINRLKEVQMVIESKALKLNTNTGKYEEYDKVVYIEEPFNIPVSGVGEAYVESSKYFSLLEETKEVRVDTDYVEMTLKNGAQYKLPKLDVKWESSPIIQKFNINNSIPLKIASTRLTSTTLKNIANPLLTCVYIDQDTGVSCNSMAACIDGTVTSPVPILLPPDLLRIIEGKESNIEIIENNFVTKVEDAYMACPVPPLDYTATADILRASIPIDIRKYPTTTLFESIKRLSAFGDWVSFDKEKAWVGDSYEPFNFPDAEPDYQYGIQYLLTVLPQTSHIAQGEFALFLYGDNYLFIISMEKGD